MLWSTGAAVLVPIYPEWSGRITSLIETFLSFGLLIGPMIGSYLYSIGDYSVPFAFAALCQIILAMICIFCLPNKCVESYDDGSHLPNFGSSNFEGNYSISPKGTF